MVMKKVFDYTKKKEMEQLDEGQQRFTAKMIVKEVERYAKEHNVSPETAYEFYRRGMLGSDRPLEW